MNNVLTLRNMLSMTQDEFAEHCNVSRISIARYEAGAEINRANAMKIASACGVSVEYVLGISDDKPVVSQEPWDVETAFSDPDYESIRIMARGMKKMSPENRQKLLDVAMTLFEQDFDEQGNKKK